MSYYTANASTAVQAQQAIIHNVVNKQKPEDLLKTLLSFVQWVSESVVVLNRDKDIVFYNNYYNAGHTELKNLYELTEVLSLTYRDMQYALEQVESVYLTDRPRTFRLSMVSLGGFMEVKVFPIGGGGDKMICILAHRNNDSGLQTGLQNRNSRDQQQVSHE